MQLRSSLLLAALGASLALPTTTHAQRGAATMAGLRSAIEATEGVASVTEPQPVAGGDVYLLNVYPTSAPQDKATSDLVHHLRNEVVPLYYDRDRDGVPRGWVLRMKRAMRTLGWWFSSDRMVRDYVVKSYVPAAGGTSSDMSRS